MRVLTAGAMARLLLVLALAAGVVLSAYPLDSLSPGIAPDSGAALAQGKNERGQDAKARKGAKKNGEKKNGNRNGSGKQKNKNKNKKDKKRDGAIPSSLDAEQIADANSAAVEALECEGLEKIRVEGRTFCTHGDDPQMFGRSSATARDAGIESVSEAGPASRPLCIDDGQSGPRVQMVYVHRDDRASRLNELLPTFRRLVSEMDTIVDQSARQSGGSLRIRFVTNAQCQVDIATLAVPENAMSSFAGTTQQLAAAGYNAENRKYLIMADASSFCGVGTFLGGTRDDSGLADDPNTTVHDFRGYARIDVPCWDAGTMIHELGHTMGAVQYSAPHTSGGAHCIDEWDVMCYSDSPYKPAMRTLCAEGAQDFRLDCNDDDYFSAQPAAGSYLDTHWNTARSIYFTDGSGEVCLDAALEPDDAYWYRFWEVPMRAFPVGGSEDHAFCDEPGDTDWILFPAESGKSYRVETSGLGPDVDTQLVVYRGFEEQGWEGMTTIGFNDDRAEGDRSSAVTFAAPGSGNFLVGISESGNRAGYDKTYTISVQETASAPSGGLALSRTKARPKRAFTATMSGVTPTSEVTFWWKRGEKESELGRATAGADGVAALLTKVPRKAKKGSAEVTATSSDAATGSAAFNVKKKGGRDNKGGKHYKRQGKRNG